MMKLEPWYQVAELRAEVREGRSFDPDEFAIHLEQVVAGSAPPDYRDPEQFFARTCFTRALREHAGMVLRRLAGETANTSPVLSLVTQFGGGKTHTLCALYHLAAGGAVAGASEGVRALLADAGLSRAPQAKAAVFVGTAWDPREGCETPWIDIARQLAGAAGVEALGTNAKHTPPGTDALGRVFDAAGAPVLILFDEVLNFMNRHSGLAQPFYSFIQNLTVAITATTRGAAVISLPRSAVEMTDEDMQWQGRISKVVRRVAKDLIANDESEIAEVVRRRIFDGFGEEKIRNKVARVYADWCFERRAELPPEWTAVDSARTEAKSREFLRGRFAACYPFHPATLSVFQRKWQALPQFQRTRGTLAMLAQWVSWAHQDGYKKARGEALITLGSAPLEISGFRSVVLGQLGEERLSAAIETDIAGEHSHARALDADTKGALRDIHRRVGTAIFFESSGGQVEKIAQLPELRFALGEPDLDTTSVDNAAAAFEDKSYFARRMGKSGFLIGRQPTLKKVVSDRRAALDEETEIVPEMRKLVQAKFAEGANIPLVLFPADGAAISDTPKLALVVADPQWEWAANGDAQLRQQIAEWSRQRGSSPRLYPASLVWCLRKPGRDLRNKVAQWLAWRRVQQDVAEGNLGADFTNSDRSDLRVKIREAEDAAKEEVWASYRHAVIVDKGGTNGLKAIDLGAGHSSSNETLSGRILSALRGDGLLNESIGVGYLERHWPEALRESGAWPLAGLRKSFLDGSLTRLLDPDSVLRDRIAGMVEEGKFGLASGEAPDGAYERIWFAEQVARDEVVFEPGVFLLNRQKAKRLRGGAEGEMPADPAGGHAAPEPRPPGGVGGPGGPLEKDAGRDSQEGGTPVGAAAEVSRATLRLTGDVPSEVWNRLGVKLLPKLKHGDELRLEIDLSMRVRAADAQRVEGELSEILKELGLAGRVRIECERS